MMFLDAVASEDGTVRAGPLTMSARHLPVLPGTPVVLGLRPEDVSPTGNGPEAEVILVEHYGGQQVVTLKAAAARLTMTAPPNVRIARGSQIAVSVAPENLYLFDPDTGRTLAAPGLDPRMTKS